MNLSSVEWKYATQHLRMLIDYWQGVYQKVKYLSNITERKIEHNHGNK